MELNGFRSLNLPKFSSFYMNLESNSSVVFGDWFLVKEFTDEGFGSIMLVV